MMYDFWIDQQPNITSGIPLGGANYPPMIPATTAIAGHTYQVTVALGNPSWNATNGNTAFPVVELSFTSGAWGGPGGYNGYGNTVAQAWANGSSDPNWQIAPGTFKDLTLTWTCPANLGGQSLNIQLNITGFTQTPGTTQPNKVAFDNIRLVDVTGAPTAPAAPSNLAAATISSSQITLNWTDNSNNETAFKIDRATDSGFTQNVTTATVGADVATYSDAGLSSTTTYYYRVRATNDVGDSANTSTASATTAAIGTPVPIPVPDGNFDQDGAAGGGWAGSIKVGGSGTGTLVGPQTAALAGWSIVANPSTDLSGAYGSNKLYGGTCGNLGLGGSFGAVYSGSMPGGTNTMGVYYPGEQETGSNGSLYNPRKAQSGADVTFTTTGISATAVAGTTYTASMYYDQLSNVSNANACPNVTFSILANGVAVGMSGSGAGLAYNSPWTQLTATWTATAADAGKPIQLQIYANNFLEGTQQWQVATLGLTDVTLTGTAQANVPAAPSGLTATAASSSQINLSLDGQLQQRDRLQD